MPLPLQRNLVGSPQRGQAVQVPQQKSKLYPPHRPARANPYNPASMRPANGGPYVEPKEPPELYKDGEKRFGGLRLFVGA